MKIVKYLLVLSIILCFSCEKSKISKNSNLDCNKYTKPTIDAFRDFSEKLVSFEDRESKKAKKRIKLMGFVSLIPKNDSIYALRISTIYSIKNLNNKNINEIVNIEKTWFLIDNKTSGFYNRIQRDSVNSFYKKYNLFEEYDNNTCYLDVEYVINSESKIIVSQKKINSQFMNILEPIYFKP